MHYSFLTMESKMPLKDKNKLQEYQKQYAEKNKDRIIAANKKYAQENKEIIYTRNKEWSKNNHERRNELNKKYYQSLKGRFQNAKHGAIKRNKNFLLTYDEFCKIVSEPCFYCNNEMGFTTKAGSNLDRLDNLIGYEINNVVSCCWTCNNIKSDKLTVDETKAAISAILNIRKQKLLTIDKINIV